MATANILPEGYSLEAVFVAEGLLTAFFLLIIMGSTHKMQLQVLRQSQLV